MAKSFLNSTILVLVFIFCGNISSSFAQQSYTSTQYLKIITDKNQKKTDSLIALLQSYNYNIPLVKGVQFRTETKDLLLKRQEYSLRIKPNSLGAISNTKQAYNHKIEIIRVENELRIQQELEKQYLQLIDYIFNEKQQNLFSKRQNQLKDKLKLLSQQMYDTNFDVNDLITTEENLLNITLKLASLKEDNYSLQRLLTQNLLQKEPITIQLTDIIKPQKIIEVSVNKNFNFNLELSLQELKLGLIENEMRAEKAKNKQIIDYVQAKYGGRRSFLFDENFSIGLGINLPFFGNARQKKASFYLDKINEENKFADLKKEIEYTKVWATNDFNAAKLKYQSLNSQIKESSIISLLETYRKIDGVSPLILLKLEILQTKKEVELVKVAHDLYKTYIKKMTSQGLLFQQPYKNYLSNSLEQF